MAEASPQVFRVHLIYKADGMSRPLSYRKDMPASSCSEALQSVTNYVKSAYVSGFEVMSWTTENLTRPVLLNYVSDSQKR